MSRESGHGEPFAGSVEGARVDLGGGAWLPRGELRFSFSRSGGPGGQAVNKLSTRAELRVRVAAIRGLNDEVRGRLRRLAGRRLTVGDEIVLHAQTFRSQHDNRRHAIERLADLVRRSLIRPRTRVATKPSRGAVARRLEGKQRRGRTKQLRQSRRQPDLGEN